MDRERFEQLKQKENEILRGRPVGGVVNGYGADNGLTPEQTIGFINKQSAADEDWKAAKAFYNGSVNQLERGILGTLAMIKDNNIASLQAQGIAVGDGGKYIDMALNSEHLQPYEVKGKTALGQFGLDLASGAGQLVSQAALALTTGGVGSTVAMGASIAGNQYADLRKEGVSVERATNASLINAAVQAPLERLSIGNILSKLPAGSGMRQKAIQIAQNAVTEGVTEYAQQYPEEITNLYAKSGGNLEELANATIDKLPEIHQNALYAGAIGALLGGGAGTINVALQRNMNAAQLEAVEGRVEQAKQIGITPEAYANTVNNNLPESNVSVDGDALLKFMQSGKTEEIAQSLGVTVNEVQQAADEGLTVEIRQGNYEGTAMKYADFMPAVRDYSAFEVNGFMQSDTQGQKELQKEYQQFTDNEEEFQAYKDEKIAEMQAAGINKQEALNAMILLESRARVYNPDNPLAFFEAYPIEFRRGTDGGEFNQPEVLDNDTANLRSIQKALENFDFENVPNDVIETGVKVANALKHAATQYFEAKPQRAVRIEEFAGAVVPKGTNPELINRLKEAGLQVEEYDKTVPGSRRAATQKVQSSNDVLFQSANEGNRGSIRWNNDGAAIVELFSAADASTFVHESIGHYFANVLAKEAVLPGANEQIVKDFETMLDYAGTTRERWEYLNSKPRPALTKDEDKELVKMQETWATAAEQYILEGKAPNRELQPVFNRFKKWLLNVYKTIESFVKNNQYAVPITDEVRQVFDRMLASEQQISEMEKLNGYYAKLPKAITDNLSDAYKTRLYDAMAKAHDKAVQLLTRKSLENFTAERKEQIAEYRADMRPKVAEQVDNEPLYRAINELLEDNKHYKAGKALAEHYYDMVARSKNIEAKPLTEQEEMEVMTFDMFAESYGFSSGDDLAKAILESPTRQQAIKQRLDDEVQKKFPDIYKERRLAEAATQEAFYNDDTGAVLGLEEQIIEDAAKRTLDQQRNAEQQRQLAQMKRQQAKVQAQGYLRSVPLREALRIQKYITAERRAAANAATALGKGDYETALDYKHKQLLNHAMVQESINMNRRYTQYGKFLNRQRKLKKESWNNEENFMQVGALFARMGLRLRGYDARLKQQSLKEWADAMQADYDNVAIPDWVYDESRTFTRPLSDLTFDEYEDVVNTLKNIKAVVKAQTMMEGEAKAKTFAETKAEGMAVLEKKPTKYTPDVNEKGKASAFAKFKRQLRNSDNFFEMIDGWTYGWYSKFFGETVRKAADVEAELTMQYEDATRQAYKEWLPDKAARKAASVKVKYDELGTSATKHTLIYMALNLGNESNAAKLCSTAVNSTFREFFPQSQLWVEGDAIQTKKNLLEFLGRNLTAADWRYVQKKIDIANMYWTQMSELERRDKGFAPPKVEAYPEIITLADGQQIVYRGGYFPLIRRRDTGSHPASQDAIPATTGGRPGDSIRTLHTNTGHTKARDNSVYPIDLTGGGEYAVAMDTIHDIAFREPMNNFRKLMNDREFYNMLKSKLGIADMEALEEFVKKAAQPYGGSGFATLSERDTGKFMSWLRNKTVNAAIMLNFKTSLQNLGNPLLYGRVVDGFGYADVLAAYANYQKNWQGRKGFHAMRDFVYGKSVFMRERGQLPDISLRDMKDEGAELNPIEKRTIKWGTQMLTFTDNLSALPVWLQAYQKKINAKASEQEAIQFADTVIRRTLGSSRITDVAPIQRGGPLMKLLTTFQGFFNTQYNQWNREFNVVTRLIKEGSYGTAAGRVTAFAASKFLLFNLLNLALALENPFDNDDDDGWPKIASELLHYPISLLGPVGGIANATLNNMLGIRDYGYNMTAIEGSLDKLFKAGKLVGDIADGDKDVEEAVEPVAGVATMAAGIPNQLNKLFFNAWDILYNDMDAEWRDLFYRRPSRDR